MQVDFTRDERSKKSEVNRPQISQYLNITYQNINYIYIYITWLNLTGAHTQNASKDFLRLYSIWYRKRHPHVPGNLSLVWRHPQRSSTAILHRNNLSLHVLAYALHVSSKHPLLHPSETSECSPRKQTTAVLRDPLRGPPRRHTRRTLHVDLDMAGQRE